MEAVDLRGVVINVMSGHGVDPFFGLHMLEFVNEWQKMWFFLRNDVVAPLPVFTGNCTTPPPPNQLGVWGGQDGPLQVVTGEADGCTPSMDIPQLPDSIAPSVSN
jgi:hypothetical protein